MSKTSSQPLANALSKVVDLLVESRIRIDAMEQILVKTNSVAYPLYLGMIENLQRQKAADVNRVFTRTLKSRSTQR
jgi:carbohydrate-binding DOMON domain-containing protein